MFCKKTHSVGVANRGLRGRREVTQCLCCLGLRRFASASNISAFFHRCNTLILKRKNKQNIEIIK